MERIICAYMIILCFSVQLDVVKVYKPGMWFVCSHLVVSHVIEENDPWWLDNAMLDHVTIFGLSHTGVMYVLTVICCRLIEIFFQTCDSFDEMTVTYILHTSLFEM